MNYSLAKTQFVRAVGLLGLIAMMVIGFNNLVPVGYLALTMPLSWGPAAIFFN